MSIFGCEADIRFSVGALTLRLVLLELKWSRSPPVDTEAKSQLIRHLEADRI
jgi:hypothetical protein